MKEAGCPEFAVLKYVNELGPDPVSYSGGDRIPCDQTAEHTAHAGTIEAFGSCIRIYW